MQPNLTPQPGTPIHSLSQAMGIVGRVARQTAANAHLEISGPVSADIGADGVRLSVDHMPKLQCFEITSCWKTENPTPRAGGSLGTFWVCEALPVSYWWKGTHNDSFWSTGVKDCGSDSVSGDADGADQPFSKLFWPVKCCNNPDCGPCSCGSTYSECPEQASESGSCATDHCCHENFYPRYGISDWVWCVFDAQADVWRVLDAHDDFIRFRLCEPMDGCDFAWADVLGYDCGDCEEESSGSIESLSSIEAEKHVCRVVKDIHCKNGKLVIEYCELHLAPGSWCDCGVHCDDSQSASASDDAPPCSESEIASGCLGDTVKLGAVRVYDRLGIGQLLFAECIVPKGTTGWALWRADSRKFEVLAYGSQKCWSSKGKCRDRWNESQL